MSLVGGGFGREGSKRGEQRETIYTSLSGIERGPAQPFPTTTPTGHPSYIRAFGLASLCLRAGLRAGLRADRANWIPLHPGWAESSDWSWIQRPCGLIQWMIGGASIPPPHRSTLGCRPPPKCCAFPKVTRDDASERGCGPVRGLRTRHWDRWTPLAFWVTPRAVHRIDYRTTSRQLVASTDE